MKWIAKPTTKPRNPRKLLRRCVLVLISLLISGLAILYCIPLPSLLNGISFSRAIYDDQHKLLRLTLSDDEEYRLFMPLSKIPNQVMNATLLQEDQYFHFHRGINPVALIKAVWQTYFIQSRRVGASTITMQVARLRYHIPSKNMIGKLKQMFRALQIELRYSKNQILEAYLNLAPYGNNIQGIGAASLIYFGKTPQELTLPEILTLVVIPQNPNARNPLHGKLKESRDKLFERWVVQHPSDRNKKNLISLPLQIQNIHQLPFLAPHFVNGILENPPSDHEIITTLDQRAQKILEKVTEQFLLRKKNLGVHNASVLLIDTRDMGVKGLVGSADFYNKKIQGQINGTLIKRSPGSALKPFIYGLALDQGLIHPNTVLKDTPHSFGTYNPENFDHDFMGPIKAKDALILSRNIPAIYLASQLTTPNLYQFLEDAHIARLKSENYYGLALVLGGAEVTMNELVSLYAMLVNDGIWHPLRTLKDQPKDNGKRLLSPEASFLILDMLKETQPPNGLNKKENPLHIAWKTGTSSGFRDAWTIGTFGPYVMAVWIGNFDNKGNPNFIGKEIAAPLFFEITSALQQEMGKLPIITKNLKQLHLERIAVCKASGMLPTRSCKDTELTWFIPGKSPIKTDTVFREIAIDKKTNLRVCQYNENTRFEIYEFWPSDLLKIFKEAGMQRRTPPPFEENCFLRHSSGFNPQITSPRIQLNYIISARTQYTTRIPLTALADADVATLYWFINETFLVKTPRDQVVFWNAKPGQYVLRVVDDQGRSDVRDVIVKSM